MSKKEKVTTTEEAQSGRTVLLPNGQKRIEYIRDEFYTNGVTRSDIKKAINEMLPEGEGIPYQIVFGATKTKEDPRIATAERRDKAAKAKADREAEAAEAKQVKADAKAKAEAAAKDAAKSS